jgi:hypothetical protein
VRGLTVSISGKRSEKSGKSGVANCGETSGLFVVCPVAMAMRCWLVKVESWKETRYLNK